MTNSARRVLGLSAPLGLAAILTPLLSLVETGVAGTLPGAHGMAAVALGAMLFNFMFWAFSFLRFGTTGLTAQAFGKGDHDEVRLTLLRGLILASAFGVLLIGAGRLLLALALALIDAGPEVEQLAALYVHKRLYGVPAALAIYVLLGFAMGLAKTGLTMVLEALRGCFCIGAIGVSVASSGASVEGIALASVGAEWVAALLTLLVVLKLVRATPAAPLSLSRIFDLRAFRRLLALNGDLFVRTQCLLVVLALFTAEGARQGDAVLAANSALINTLWLFTYAVGAFAAVASSLVGHAVGARDHAALLSAVRTTTALAAFASVVACVALGFGGDSIVAQLTGSTEVRRLARTYLPYVAALPPISVLSLQLDGIAVGAGQLRLLRNTFLAAALGGAAVHLLTTPSLGNHGVWLGFATFMALRSVGFFPAYRQLVAALPAPMMQRDTEPR